MAVPLRFPDPPDVRGLDYREDGPELINWIRVLTEIFGPGNIVANSITSERTAQQTAAKAIEILEQVISPSPTDAEVATIQAKVNEVILLLRGETPEEGDDGD